MTRSRILFAAALCLLALPCEADGQARKPLVLKNGQVQQVQAGETITVSPATTAAASINIPHGTAPTSPANGDCWSTTLGLYCRVNGVTHGPLIGGTWSGPTWASYTSLYAPAVVNVNGYATSDMFGNGTSKVVQALTGALAIPATDTGNQLGAGVFGYANTASTTQAAVGVFGFGGIAAANGNAWGLNSVTTNTRGVNTGTGNGFDANVLAGTEINFNIWKKAGAVTPNIAEISGIKIIGDSDTIGNPGTEVFGINIESPGFQQSPELKWYRAIRVRDGSSNVALSVGAVTSSRLGAPTSAASQDIEFVTFGSSANRQISRIYADSTATIFVAPTGGFNLRTTVGTVNAMSVAAGGNVAFGLSAPLAPFQIQADGAVATSGQMNTGLVLQSGSGGRAISIGSSSAGSENWINSGFSNNAGVAAPLTIYMGGVNKAKLDTSAHAVLTVAGGVQGIFARTVPTTVSNLTTVTGTPTQGDRAFVTDATACTFATAVTGGGSVACPVYYDGATWKAG